MTEAEWLATTFSTPMFALLRERSVGSQRKRLLLALTCCEQVLDGMSEAGRRAVEVARRYLDGRADEAERWAAFERAGMAADEAADLRRGRADWCAYRTVQLAAETEPPATWDDDTAAQIAQTMPEAFSWTGSGWDEDVLEAHRALVAEWVRDVFGNPFRPVAVDPRWLAWNGGAVPRLAREIAERRAFERLPALADALQQRGAPRLRCWATAAMAARTCRGAGWLICW
jgi:hypothetical protein